MYETQSEEPVRRSPVKVALTRLFKGLYDILETLVIAGAFVVFVYLFIASPHEVVGRSMEQNFWNGEYLLADKISYHFNRPERGDVVIFKHSDTADYIKRVIGLPGDTVSLRDGSFYVNGTRVDESEYLAADVYTDPGPYLREGDEKEVPSGQYFVAGDNRPHSSDSRTFGPIDEESIKGRAVLIYWPFSKLSLVPKQTYAIQ